MGTEVFGLDTISSLLSSSDRPDLVQLMMDDYSATLEEGLQDALQVSKATGFSVTNFTLGVKPQCGVQAGSVAYLKTALPDISAKGVGIMLWNMGRDYPCPG